MTNRKCWIGYIKGILEKAVWFNRKNLLWQLDEYLFEPSLMEESSDKDETSSEYVRNKLLLANLERMIRSKAFKEIGIVYGCWHFHEVEPLLKGMGYEVNKVDKLRVFGLNDPIENPTN